MMVRPLPRISKLAMFALLSLACAKSPPSGGPGTYRGVATGTKEIGILEVTVTESDKGPLPATGTLKFPSKSLALTGTLDKSKTELSLSSSDGYKIVGESRPNYAYGAYQNATGEDAGAFGLLLQTESSPIEFFCGSFVDASDNDSKGTTLPLGITAVPGGGAICVGPNFAWLGGLGTDNSLSCTSTGGAVIEGNLNTTANPWGTGQTYGTWVVAPCASNGGGGDGGVQDGSSADDATVDAGTSD
jgi:hypothetical protein